MSPSQVRGGNEPPARQRGSHGARAGAPRESLAQECASVTVVICTVDRSDALAACLASLELQTQPPEEVVVVQGVRGADGGALELEPLTERHPRLALRCVPCEERNISLARNLGAAAASSELLLFIDDDATAEADWVEVMRCAFEGQPERWIVGGDVYDSREPGRVLEFSHGSVDLLGRQRPVATEPPRARRGWRYANVKGCNFGVRASALEAVGGFDEVYAFAYDETDLVLRIARAGGQLVHMPEAVVHHAHVPGLFRQADPLDRDWEVEFRSHLYFCLRHGGPALRWLARGLVRLRLARLMWRRRGARLVTLRAVRRGLRGAERAAQAASTGRV